MMEEKKWKVKEGKGMEKLTNQIGNEINEVRGNPLKKANSEEGNKTEKKESLAEELIIEGIDIVRTFKMGEVQVRALQGVNVKIRRGEFIAIMGPSGSGKTTLLNQLGLLDTPNSGKVIIDKYGHIKDV